MNAQIVPGLNVTNSETFEIGSHKDDVARLQGTPYRIAVPTPRTTTALRKDREERRASREFAREVGLRWDPQDHAHMGKYSKDEDPDRETWYYEGGVVELSIATGRVTAWDNQDGSLKAQARWAERDKEWKGEEHFTFDSTQSDVKRVQGEPLRESREGTHDKTWHYGTDLLSSEVEFLQGRVVAWSKGKEELKVRAVPGPNVTTGPTFQLGSHKDDVIRLQGTPRGISAMKSPLSLQHGGGFEKWRYGGADVSLSISGHVIDWSNPEGILKVQGIRPERKLPRDYGSSPAKVPGCLTTVVGLGLVVVTVILSAMLFT